MLLESPRRNRTARVRASRRRRVLELASTQGGVVTRRQVYALGLTRGEVRANVRAGRWRRLHSQSICIVTGSPSTEAEGWAAIFEAGPRAYVDGDSALIAAGLRNYTPGPLRVSVPRGAKVRRVRGVNVRQTRRWQADDVIVDGGIPRSRPAVAAVRGALWARSNRQAALLLTMTVQQGLAPAEELGLEALRIRRDRRRSLIHDVINDLLDGARSLGEIDFAKQCRARDIPEPSRQAVRKGPDGRWYLDAEWAAYGVVVEIDGIQHSWATQVVPDALRQNALTLAGDKVLRLPLLGLRVNPDEFFDQICAALVAGGWPGRHHE